MKRLTALSLLTTILFCFNSSAQINKSLPRHYAELSGGRCFHASGDIRGLVFTTEYSQYFKKKLSWIVSLSGTIHDGSFPEIYTVNGQRVDGSVQYTVAGVQVAGHLGYSIVRNKQHELQLRLGILARYQSSSLSDEITTYYPAITNLPVPVMVFYNSSPQRTFAPGGSIQVHYNYTINNAIAIGVLAGFQADTEGDNLSQISLTVGYRFNKIVH